MKDFIKFTVFNIVVWTAVFGFAAAYAQEDASECIEKHPNGVTVWGCYEGEPYWDIAEFAGEKPMVSGGTLYTPSKRPKELGMGGRIIENAVWNAKWRTEAEINRKIERGIGNVLDKAF